jgi:hypothetical protein
MTSSVLLKILKMTVKGFKAHSVSQAPFWTLSWRKEEKDTNVDVVIKQLVERVMLTLSFS